MDQGLHPTQVPETAADAVMFAVAVAASATLDNSAATPSREEIFLLNYVILLSVEPASCLEITYTGGNPPVIVGLRKCVSFFDAEVAAGAERDSGSTPGGR